MSPSPGEIRQHEFPSERKGYDRSAVRQYLREIGDRVERLEAELSAVRAEAESARAPRPAVAPSGLSPYEELGQRVAGLLENAEQSAAAIVADAEARSGALRNDAEQYASARRAEADQLFAEAQREADTTRQAAVSYAQQVRTEAEAEALETRRSAEADAHSRSSEILSAAQGRLDRLTRVQRALRERLETAAVDVQTALSHLEGDDELSLGAPDTTEAPAVGATAPAAAAPEDAADTPASSDEAPADDTSDEVPADDTADDTPAAAQEPAQQTPAGARDRSASPWTGESNGPVRSPEPMSDDDPLAAMVRTAIGQVRDADTGGS